ncbi:TPA: hypothetical protein NH827_003866 [Pseudomonas aeruginosa]|uniref:hypothetical protein n=1 Tax=Pseudomonas aeruginosa TaxID=287 RepID=UPI001E556586|nr:hypothetical protein [Pseudomonas aeruginosa]MCD2773153.1 hypothetical protein [Pseudomonas aeruginosa]HCF1405873.1 hypothetical protein [Pseudomonas aeruginosa]
MSKELNKEPAEQAGGDERVVDGKPRATKCPDCGEGDLMPGDLCACGYETDPAAGYACSECDGSGEGCVGEVCRECDGSGWFVTPEQARAALAQPSPAQAEQAEPERPEVVAWQYRVTAGPQTGWSLWHPGKGEEFERSYTVERRPLMTVAQHERIVKAWIERWKAYIELSAKIAAQRDAANARLHEVATACATAEQERDAALAEVERLRQFERICEGLPQDAIDSGWTVQGIRRYAKRLEDQLKVALARVAELERELSNEENAHTTTIEQRDNAEHWADQLANAIAERFGVDIGEHSNLNCPWNEALVWMQQLPAQAQHSVPDGAADLCRFLAKLYCELDGLRYSTAKLPAEQIADALIFKWPVLQGARNQLNIKRISEQPYDESKLHSAIAAMLAAAPGKEGL